MQLEKFEDKLVPPVPDLEGTLTKDTTQGDLCGTGNCEDIEELDCGNCLFSSTFCSKSVFDHWKNQKLESYE